MRTAAPLFVLRAVWHPGGTLRAPSVPEAQALEYASRMGTAALRRQWVGSPRTLAKALHRLKGAA